MVTLRIHRYLAYFGVIVVALIILSALSLFVFNSIPSTKVVHAATLQTQNHDLADPSGATWNLTVSFINGTRAGQTESQTMTFTSHGTLSETVNGVSGTGFWWPTGANTFTYTFKEPVYGGPGQIIGYISVWQSALLVDSHDYNSGGEGVFTLPDGTAPQPLQYNDTVTVATR